MKSYEEEIEVNVFGVIQKLKSTVTPPKPLAYMHHEHGETPDRKCGDCANLVVREFTKNYYKCKLYGTTGNPATDWVKRWPACGKFEEGK